MTLCNTCGNDFGRASNCPYCGARQGTGAAVKRTRGIRTLDLERGRPRVDEALARLDTEIAAARMRGVRLLRVIHGWGSSGAGGAIKMAVETHLERLHRERRIRSFLPGGGYSEDTNRGRELLRAYPALRDSLRTDRENPGITFVEP